MSFEVADRRSPIPAGLRQVVSHARRIPAVGVAAGLSATASVRLAATSASADWRLWSKRDLLAAGARRIGRSIGAALVAAGLMIWLARWQAGSSWMDVAALAALLMVATSAMLGLSRALGDGADRTLSVLLAGWTAALVTGIGLWSTPLRENPLLSLAALGMLVLLAFVGQGITYLLSYTVARLVLTSPEP